MILVLRRKSTAEDAKDAETKDLTAESTEITEDPVFQWPAVAGCQTYVSDGRRLPVAGRMPPTPVVPPKPATARGCRFPEVRRLLEAAGSDEKEQSAVVRSPLPPCLRG